MVRSDAVCTLTNVKDFAVGLVGLLNNPKAYGEAFHITSNYTYTWRKVAEIIGKAIGIEPDIFEINIESIKQILNPGFEIEELIADKTRDMVFDNSKIKNIVLDYTGNISFEEAILETIDYFTDESKQIVDYLWDGCVDRIISQCCKTNITWFAGQSIRSEFVYCVGRNEILYRIAKIIKG